MGNQDTTTHGGEDLETLEEDAAILNDIITKLTMINEYIMNTTDQCNYTTEEVTAKEYFNFVFNDFYLPLTDMDTENYTAIDFDQFLGDDTDGLVSQFMTYAEEGIKCLSGSNMLDTVVIRVVIGVYIEMCQLNLAIVYEEILELDGDCPAGFEIGDWSDGGGECCCDPSYQPEEEGETTLPPTGLEPYLLREEPVPIDLNGEEPVTVTPGGEEPITVGPGGEEPITVGPGGEEPITVSSGEEPITVTPGGEEPISLTPSGEEPILVNGEEPITVPTGEEPISISGEEPILIGEEPIEILPPRPTLPPLPEAYIPNKCQPRKKYCKCRTSTPRPPTGGPTGLFTPTLITGGPTDVTGETTTSFLTTGVQPFLLKTDSENSTTTELPPTTSTEPAPELRKQELSLMEKLSRMVQSIL